MGLHIEDVGSFHRSLFDRIKKQLKRPRKTVNNKKSEDLKKEIEEEKLKGQQTSVEEDNQKHEENERKRDILRRKYESVMGVAGSQFEDSQIGDPETQTFFVNTDFHPLDNEAGELSQEDVVLPTGLKKPFMTSSAKDKYAKRVSANRKVSSNSDNSINVGARKLSSNSENSFVAGSRTRSTHSESPEPLNLKPAKTEREELRLRTILMSDSRKTDNTPMSNTEAGKSVIHTRKNRTSKNQQKRKKSSAHLATTSATDQLSSHSKAKGKNYDVQSAFNKMMTSKTNIDAENYYPYSEEEELSPPPQKPVSNSAVVQIQTQPLGSNLRKRTLNRNKVPQGRKKESLIEKVPSTPSAPRRGMVRDLVSRWNKGRIRGKHSNFSFFSFFEDAKDDTERQHNKKKHRFFGVSKFSIIDHDTLQRPDRNNGDDLPW